MSSCTPDELMSRILHLDMDDDERFAALLPGSHRDISGLFCDLDRALRLRNPGLQYVHRKMYLGYRRELNSSGGGGERSQIFASVLRSSTSLDLVVPLDPLVHGDFVLTRDLSSHGHHGIGDLRCTITTSGDLDSVLERFDSWLRPGANAT